MVTIICKLMTLPQVWLYLVGLGLVLMKPSHYPGFSSSFRSFELQRVTSQYATLWNPAPIMTLPAASVLHCAVTCINGSPNCTAVSFDDVSLSCVLGKCAVTQSAMPNSVHIYQTQQAKCNDYPGFNIITIGSTSACLMWSSTIANFTNAKDNCTARGAVLATFKTWEMLEMILNKTELIFIGLDDIQEEGVFRWHDDGSLLENMTMFRAVYPANDSDCVLFDGSMHFLREDYCYHEHYYVCQIVCFDF